VSELAIGIDIGGSHVEYGFVRGSELLASETIPVREPLLKAVLPEVESGVRRLQDGLVWNYISWPEWRWDLRDCRWSEFAAGDEWEI